MGFIYILGQTNNDFGFIKYDQNGNLLGIATYWPGGFDSGGGEYFDITPNGDVYITGNVYISITGWIYTVKFNSSGVFQWGKLYNLDNNDEPHDIKIDKVGNILIAGSSIISSNSFIITLKYNSNGDTLWTKHFNNGQNSASGNKITIDNLSNIYIAGTAGIPGDCIILKYNQSGNLDWSTNFISIPGRPNIGQGIALDTFGNIYVLGTVSVLSSGLNNYLLKLNNGGVILWNKVFSGIVSGQGRNSGIPVGPVVSSDGSSIYYSTKSSNGTGGGGYSISTVKYNSSSDSQWVKIFSGGSVPATANVPGNIKLDKNGNIYICGRGYYQVSGDDFITVKYTPSGMQQWVAIYSGLVTNGGDAAYDLLLDTNENVYVTGETAGFSSPGSAVTIKYNQPLGVMTGNSQLPENYFLYQNYPNPFNPKSDIQYEVAKDINVTIKIYNVLGQLVTTLVNNEMKKAGAYKVSFDGTNYASGLYIYRIEAGTFVEAKKMMLIK